MGQREEALKLLPTKLQEREKLIELYDVKFKNGERFMAALNLELAAMAQSIQMSERTIGELRAMAGIVPPKPQTNGHTALEGAVDGPPK